MDPSLSISTDPQHHPSQFAPFPPFLAHNPFSAGAVNAAIFGGLPAVTAPVNNHVTGQSPPNPSFNHPPYDDMICAAIAALNEPDGSSKQAISRYIERVYTGLPPTHAALLTHHLKSLKNNGVLVMLKKSYKFASASPRTDVHAATSTLEARRSDIFGNPNDMSQSDLNASASAPPKRGRGRPPKPKPEALAGVQLNAAEPSPVVRSNGQPGSESNTGQLVHSACGSDEETQVAKRRPGRPRKNGSQAAVQATSTGNLMKRRGRPPGRSGPGRPKKPKSFSALSTLFPYVGNGSRRRGRPRRADSAPGVSPAVMEGKVVAPQRGKRRGRPPKIGGVITKPMKPKRSTGRPVGRPRKNATWATTEVSESRATEAYGELQRKLELFQEKIKQAVGMLRDQVAGENHVAISAINELEGLVAMDIREQPAQEAEQREPQPERQTQSQEEAEAEARAEAEVMQALF